MPISSRRFIAAAIALGLAAPALAARVSTEHGIDFVTVGAPGNRDMRTQERYYNINTNPVTEKVGRVNYRYRIGRTEVTAGQYLQFVRAFGEHWENLGQTRGSLLLHGGYFTPTTLNPSVNTDYTFISGAQGPSLYGNKAIRVDWRVAAYFCNYLHNGAPVVGDVNQETIPWAVFATGAYDAPTTMGPGPLTPTQRLPGARFWLPTLDEWTKAAYYDPERYAEGNPDPYGGAIPDQEGTGGYWLYPHSSMNEPIIGNPGVGEVGGYIPGSPFPLDVGSYPDVQSPWGALDMMGSEREWTGTPSLSPEGFHGGFHFTRGTDNGILEDVNDYFFTTDSFGFAVGVRLVAAIPAPGAAVTIALSCMLSASRSRRG